MTTTLCFQDVHHIVSGLSKDVRNIIKDYNLFLAGGYIRAKIANEEVNDIDLICPSTDIAERAANQLAISWSVKPHSTINAYTLIAPPRKPVQFIKRWTFEDAVPLIESLDFTISQACVWFEDGKWHSVASDFFYRDLAAKRLHYTFPNRHEEAGGSILRAMKFLRKGYNISPDDLAKVIARMLKGVHAEGNTFWQEGEVAQSQILTGILRHVDPLLVIDGLEPSNDSLETPDAEEVVAA